MSDHCSSYYPEEENIHCWNNNLSNINNEELENKATNLKSNEEW